MLALIDADNVAFACAASAEDADLSHAIARTQSMLEGILMDTGAEQAELWLSGKNNFRYKIYPEYKGNRLDAWRPRWEKDVKAWMRDSEWQANTTDGIEADDMLGIRQLELSSLLSSNSIICHLDKDINQIPGAHYNWELNRLGKCIREKRKYFVTLEEGNRFFWYQLLVGDTTDNIKGASGVGPKKAETLLESLRPDKWYQAIENLFSCPEELDLNAQCVYIHRKHNDSWRNLLK